MTIIEHPQGMQGPDLGCLPPRASCGVSCVAVGIRTQRELRQLIPRAEALISGFAVAPRLVIVATTSLSIFDGFALSTGLISAQTLDSTRVRTALSLAADARAHVPDHVNIDLLICHTWDAPSVVPRLRSNGCDALLVARHRLVGREALAIQRTRRALGTPLHWT